MDDINIRPALESDVDFITRCLLDMMVEVAQFGGHPVNEEQLAWNALLDRALSGFESDQHTFMCAEDTDRHRRAGITEISVKVLPDSLDPQRTMHIHTCYVTPNYRGQGIGKALYHAAIYWGRRMECTEIELNVLEDNPARQIYESLGFHRYQSEYRKPI